MISFLRNHFDRILSKCPPDRLLALDVLRGLTITAMVIVNNPGSWSHIYGPLKHADWHGYTPTDLIFPFFVFMVGISIGIVQARPSSVMHHKTVWVRAAKLYGLGLFLFLFYVNFQSPSFSWVEHRLGQIRIMGVLQRLALVFLVTFYLEHYLSRKSLSLTFVGILLLYWLTMMFVPYAAPDGTVYRGNLEFGNSFAAYLDATLLGQPHLYYKTAIPFAFDPEGIWSTLPAIASAISGVLSAHLILAKDKDNGVKAKLLALYGVSALAIGYGVGEFFPINKQLWTPSFVLVTTGWALISLSILIWILDIKQYKRWSAPFIVFGMNAIGFFVFSGILARVLLMIPADGTSLKGFMYQNFFAEVINQKFGSLLFALSFCCICYLVFYQLYKKQIFFKV
ncbi:MAG: DUF5009 domain-containing protein [Gammaproteobacteria bacterium]|nr:DUF5009 domain-containing protein [Gammaproteobacteria bacterium]